MIAAITTGRQLLLRSVLLQFTVAVVLALAILPFSAAQAVAAAVGVCAVALGYGLSGWWTFRTTAPAATTALLRWFGGTLLRWLCVGFSALLAIAVGSLPALGVLAGIIIGELTCVMSGALLTLNQPIRINNKQA